MATKFVQIIEFETDTIDEMNTTAAEFDEKTRGRRPDTHALTLADRDRPGHYFVVVEFPSAEAAAESDKLPETQEMSKVMMALTKGEPTFYNLDVIDETH